VTCNDVVQSGKRWCMLVRLHHVRTQERHDSLNTGMQTIASEIESHHEGDAHTSVSSHIQIARCELQQLTWRFSLSELSPNLTTVLVGSVVAQATEKLCTASLLGLARLM
jgi:hypothetical protein